MTALVMMLLASVACENPPPEPPPPEACTLRWWLAKDHWRHRELHGAHESRDGLLCESHRLWVTHGMDFDGPGAGVYVTPQGWGVYERSRCGPGDERNRVWSCGEGERLTSWCRWSPLEFTRNSGVLMRGVMCFSSDPTRCR